VVSLFCRHNRFTADCPICSRGTVLDAAAGRAPRRGRDSGADTRGGGDHGGRGRRQPSPARREAPGADGATTVTGPYGAAGPYERDGTVYEVRLERVPGGLRIAEWVGARLEPRAPVLAAADIVTLVDRTRDSGALEGDEHARLEAAVRELRAERGTGDRSAERDPGGEPRAEPAADGGPSAFGSSPGRSGELRDELRVEPLGRGWARVARWVLRPGTGWDLLDAPTMLPARRYADALGDAARKGVLDS
jgi:hypothetical protein